MDLNFSHNIEVGINSFMDIDYPVVETNHQIPSDPENFTPRNRKEFDDYCEWLRENTLPVNELTNLYIVQEEY